MASLRRVSYAVAGLAPRPAPSTTVRWISSTGATGRQEPSGPTFGPGKPRGGGRTVRSGRRSRARRPGRSLALLSAAFVAGVAVYSYATSSTDDDKAASTAKTTTSQRNVVIPKAEFAFEDTATSTAAATPQQRQVDNSRAQPGVYAWGSNAGGVVAPDLALDSRSSNNGSGSIVKEPRRIPFFDGKVLRDLCLDRDVGVAVTDKGDVLQWGVGFWGKGTETAAKNDKRSGSRPLEPVPVPTLTGKDIVKVALSKDRVLALAANGTVYSLPVAQKDMKAAQQTTKTEAQSWWRRMLWSSAPTVTTASLGLRTLTPPGLGWGERVVDVSSGLEHCLLLTNRGRVFSAVASFLSFPERGQLGLPGFTWARWQQQKQEAATNGASSPPPLDQPHEVASLHGIPAAQIATGDYHSLVRARDGTLYAFGDNAAGQLGIAASPSFPGTDTPVQVPVEALYAAPPNSKTDNSPQALLPRPNNASSRTPSSSPLLPRVQSIAAGGATSFFTVAAPAPAATVDTWSCGSGIYGNLGTGKWVHISTTGPARIPALSGLREYSEATGKMVPIQLAQLAAGTTHACAVLANATNVAASSTPSPTAPSWGADVFFWGGNEYGQLGTGRRSNQSEPLHIAPLDRAPADTDAAAAGRERLALTPRTTVQLATGRKVQAEQRVACGKYVTAVYTAV